MPTTVPDKLKDSRGAAQGVFAVWIRGSRRCHVDISAPPASPANSIAAGFGPQRGSMGIRTPSHYGDGPITSNAVTSSIQILAKGTAKGILGGSNLSMRISQFYAHSLAFVDLLATPT